MSLTAEMIDTPNGLEGLIDDIVALPEGSLIYLDLEGPNLCRHGTLSLATILLPTLAKIFLVDVTTLQGSAFATPSNGVTLHLILESENWTKVLFDVRNDADALYSLYGVQLANVEDLQLWELARRTGPRVYVNGLAKCIEQDLSLSSADIAQCQRIKELGHRLFDPQCGGSYEVFNRRPLSSDIITYCCQDVMYLPRLRDKYRSQIVDAWWPHIKSETRRRLGLSQDPSYVPKGQHKALAPTGWC